MGENLCWTQIFTQFLVLHHNFGSRYARKPTKGSKDLDNSLDSPNVLWFQLAAELLDAWQRIWRQIFGKKVFDNGNVIGNIDFSIIKNFVIHIFSHTFNFR